MRPRRARRDWLFLGGYLVALVLVVALIGGSRITAITSSEGAADTALVTDDITGTVTLFDDSVVHRIEVAYDQRDYDAMIATFQTTGKKDYIETAITIDGTEIEAVGLRLKGNSTLFALSGRGPGGVAGGGGGGAAGPVPGAPAAGRPFSASGATAQTPHLLPWLVKFDEYVGGRRYQGYKDIAIRPGGLGATSQTALNESLSLKLIDAAGEAAERTMYTAFSVNGGSPVLRLVVEQPGDRMVADDFDGRGVLYKALSEGKFVYLGEEPLAYDTAFRQMTRKKQQDLAPLIDLLQWVTQASDQEFEAALGDHVDTRALARYVVLQNLLLNGDDMAGAGQNYYLWYDLDARRFVVVVWDMNLALSGNATLGPLQSATMGGGNRGPGAPNVGAPNVGAPNAGAPNVGAPNVGGGPVPTGRGGNALKERFLANATFRSLYLAEYRDIYVTLLASGRAIAELDRIQRVIAASGLVETQALASEVATVRQILQTRATSLASSFS